MKDAKSVQKDARRVPNDVLQDVRTVVFDLDGTLYNKKGLARRMVRRLWWCLPLMAVERKARGHVWKAIERTRWHRRVYLPTMVQLIDQHCNPKKEVLQLIDACAQRGITMAIYSDYGCIEEKLKVLGLDSSLFALLISSPALGERKPSAAAARKILDLLHADPQTTLFVGDREEKDGASARAVGAKFFLV